MINPTSADVGRHVVYIGSHPMLNHRSKGVIVSVGNDYVDVRFGELIHTKVIANNQLDWAPVLKTYPEHEKLKALNGKNQVVADFIEWLGENGYYICVWQFEGNTLHPTFKRRDELVGQYLGIDPERLNQEKDQMIEEVRELHRRHVT